MTLPLGDARINCLLAYAVLAKDRFKLKVGEIVSVVGMPAMLEE